MFETNCVQHNICNTLLQACPEEYCVVLQSHPIKDDRDNQDLIRNFNLLGNAKNPVRFLSQE